ncbi:MAG: FAD-dependent oxidoreductase, partial [Alphaproteobacteria bacterium]|nr:FAD-dependent oxidoreductase [Alphaproteobacteria bacterium]
MADFDIIVVGLGAVGGAALLSAARAGAKVAGFDRFAPPHMRGSTHGETRIVRAAIGEGAAYTPFAQRSFALWDQLAAETGERLVTRCGLLVLGGVLPHATHVPAGFLETTIGAARSFG